MDPISNVDRLVLILRQRLQERAKASASRADRRERPGEQSATGLDNVQAMAAIEGVDDHQLGRALIQSILAENFGPEMLNEAKFQQLVERVTEAIEADEGGASLLSRLVGELRAPGG